MWSLPKLSSPSDASMTSRRVLKAAEAIREVVSMTILTELRDPRISDVTVTLVEVSPDMRYAKIHVSVMGDEAKQKLSLRGLQNAAGFLQQKIAHRIDTRYTPRLRFVLDQGVKRSIEVSRILDEVLPRPMLAGEEDEDFDAELDAAEPLDDLWDNPDQPEHDANENR
jgi:ribosome-binding factor A